MACRESESQVISDLLASYVKRVLDRNKKMVEVIKIKEEIERKIDVSNDHNDIQQLKKEFLEQVE